MCEKEKRKKKWQDSWKWAASGEEHWLLINDEGKNEMFGSACRNHATGERHQCMCLSFLWCSFTFSLMGKKSETELTAGILTKDQKHRKD